MMLERDATLGRYVIRARIGVGGMGAVYRAYDTVLKRQVAIKTILADKTADREYLARFRREALAISRLADPHIVTLLDFVDGDPAQGEPPYMVMELLSGADLQSIIAKGPMAIERAVDILLEVCAAVGLCHRHGYVHRDLKGTNVFVTEYNSIETAKVLDFGVAKVWNENAVAEMVDNSEVTQQGVAVGTPAYLAPEILRGGAATPATDQYALGILLYSALTGGRKPFEAKRGEFRDLNLMRAIIKGDHPPPRTYRQDIPEGLEAVIERAINHEADRRFPSVHALGEALLAWASPRGRLQWTGHFTAAPPKAAPVHSMAVPAQAVLAARGGTAVDPKRSPVMAAPTEPNTTPAESREIRDLLGQNAAKRTATTKTWENDPSPRSPAEDERGIPVPRARDERPDPAEIRLGFPAVAAARVASEPVSIAATSSKIVPPPRRRPSVLVALALGAAVALGAASYLKSSRGLPRFPWLSAIAGTRTSPSGQQPVSTPPPPVPATVSPAAAPPPPSPPALPPAQPAVEAEPIAAERKVETPEKHPRHQRRRKPTVDENGIGIPEN